MPGRLYVVSTPIGNLEDITLRALDVLRACDLIVAGESARFGAPELNVGLWPYMVTVPLLRSMPPKKALELMLTSRVVGADEADRIGRIGGGGDGHENGSFVGLSGVGLSGVGSMSDQSGSVARKSRSMAASSAAAVRSTTRSPCWGPTSCRPIGSPLLLMATGTLAAGERVMLKG